MVSGLGNWVNRGVIYKIEKVMRKTCLGYVDTKSFFWTSKAVMPIQHVSRDVKQSIDTHTSRLERGAVWSAQCEVC